MSNRSRFVAFAGVAAGVGGLRALYRVRRRARLSRVVSGVGNVVTPPEGSAPAFRAADVAHAPGHRHLQLTAEVRAQPQPPPVRERPFAKHRHGLRHPGRG